MFEETIPTDFQQPTSQLQWIYSPQLTVHEKGNYSENFFQSVVSTTWKSIYCNKLLPILWHSIIQ